MMRQAAVARKTGETDIKVELDLDGSGQARINGPVKFLNHMLELFSFHSRIDLTLEAAGDTEVDGHHTVEDTGICIGDALRKALGDRNGINRYGSMILPMDETRALAAVDVSGRPFFVYQGPVLEGYSGDFDASLVQEFFRALAVHGGLTIHLEIQAPGNLHHRIEALFKAFARALGQAIAPGAVPGVPSTKGSLG
jgi:imidazoleglycerol-phosphate dehydratase